MGSAFDLACFLTFLALGGYFGSSAVEGAGFPYEQAGAGLGVLVAFASLRVLEAAIQMGEERREE